ncbi:MAG: radical SAM protein [Marinilabiliales bacterium]|nr:MAG: radical SAM protein [Marinilabiliales bacterium]
MATFLFDRVVFGPVRSRRLGVSLGINLLPGDRKWCSFNCIYCECGWTNEGPYEPEGFPPGVLVKEELEKKLHGMAAMGEKPDTITFAGNGEPTLHPEFAGVINDTLEIRDRLAPNALIAVLSNATMLDDPSVFEALAKVDQNILKIDSAREATVRLLNQPGEGFSLDRTIENIARFNGRFILQTLFVRGVYNGVEIDNASPGEVGDWLKLVERLQPEMVMVYTIARDTPSEGLYKVPPEELDNIAAKVRETGPRVQVSY